MAEARSLGNVEGLGEVFQIAAPLDEQIKAFEDVGIAHPYLVTPAETAMIRIAGLSNDFTRTSVAPVKVKGAKTVLYKPSPLMNRAMAFLAVQQHRNGKYLEMPRELYDAVEAIAKSEEGIEPEDRTAIVVSQDGNFNLTPEMDETRFLLEGNAGKYIEKFSPKGIPFFGLDADSKNATVNYVWFGSPQGGSYLNCWGRGLGDGYGAFGVRRVSGEASARKIRYSLTEIGKANSEVIPVVLQEAGLSGLANTITRPLSKGLLEKLRMRSE